MPEPKVKLWRLPGSVTRSRLQVNTASKDNMCKQRGKVTLSKLVLKLFLMVKLWRLPGKLMHSRLWLNLFPKVKVRRLLGHVTHSRLWSRLFSNVKFWRLLGKATPLSLWGSHWIPNQKPSFPALARSGGIWALKHHDAGPVFDVSWMPVAPKPSVALPGQRRKGDSDRQSIIPEPLAPDDPKVALEDMARNCCVWNFPSSLRIQTGCKQWDATWPKKLLIYITAGFGICLQNICKTFAQH